MGVHSAVMNVTGQILLDNVQPISVV